MNVELESKNQALSHDALSMQSTLTQFMNERDSLNSTVRNQQKLIDT